MCRCWSCAASPAAGVAVFDIEASDGTVHEFGTTGLTYHGRPLLFDRATNSLWDPVSGAAIAGPLAEAEVSLMPRPMVYASWGEWSARYPNTSTLTLETGYVRDYASEAVPVLELTALQTTVPPRPEPPQDAPPLRPDAPVLGLTIEGQTRAYPIADLVAERIVHDDLGGLEIVFFALGAGLAVSVFDATDVTFDTLDGGGRAALEVTDSDGVRWFMDDELLINVRNSRERGVLSAPHRRLGRLARRLPRHRSVDSLTTTNAVDCATRSARQMSAVQPSAIHERGAKDQPCPSF